MIKKLISSLIILTIILSNGAASISFAENSAGRVILSTEFDSSESILNNSVLYWENKGETIAHNTDGFMQIKRNTEGSDPYFDVDISAQTADSIIISADFRASATGICADLFKIRYSDNSMATFVALGNNGNVISGGKTVCNITEKMANIAVLYKKSGEYEVYVNGEYKCASTTGKNLLWQFIRTQILPSGSNGTLDVDNFRIYAAESYCATSQNYILNKDFNDRETLKDGFVRAVAGSGNSMDYIEDGYVVMGTTSLSADPYIDAFIPDSDTFSSLVFSADFEILKKGAGIKILQARNSDKQYLTDINISVSGDVHASGETITRLTEGTAVNIAAVYNIEKSTYDIYVDGIKKITGVASGFTGAVERVRTQILPNTGTGNLKIDNFRIYEGNTIIETPDSNDVVGFSVLPESKADIYRLDGAVAYHTAADYVFYDGQKHEISARPYFENGKLYIPYEIAFPITGETKKTGSVLISELCNEYDKELFYDETGLLVITDGEFRYKSNTEVIKRLSTYMFSVRPDAKKITELFEASENSGIHPRILATKSDFSYFASQLNTGSRISDWLDNLMYRADTILLKNPCEYRLQEFRLNAVVHEMLERILTLSLLYNVTDDEKYAERAYREMEAAINFPDWNPQHFLDTAELTFAMAIGYDWCYDYLLKNGKTADVESAIMEKGLSEGDKQLRGHATGTSFVFQNMNWNSVCNAGMTVGALALMEKEPDFTSLMISNNLRSLEYMLPPFAPDGAWAEGMGYWEYALGYLVKMAQSLETALGTDFHIADFTGIENTALYAVAMQGNNGSNNYHDSSVNTEISPVLLWLGNHFNMPEITSYYLGYTDNNVQNDELWRVLFYDRKTASDISHNFSKDILLDSVEAVSMRSSFDDKNGLWLSFHGGKNKVNHRHYDAGTFVLDMLGERWASDIGSEPLSYLGTAGEKLYRVRTEGHNTLVINPSEDKGQSDNADCGITQFVSKEKGAYATVDLTSAYENQAQSVLRGFMLTDDRRTAVIRDEITVGTSSDIYWFMHTMANVKIEDDNTAILTIGNKSMQLKMVCEGADAQLYVTDALPFAQSPQISGQADNSAYRKIAIRFTTSSTASISVRLTPLDEKFADTAFNPKKISEWSVDDGKISYTAPFGEKEYIIHSELFDNDFSNLSSIFDNGKAKINAMTQSGKTVIERRTGIGTKSDNDGCVAIATNNLFTQSDPFIQVEFSDVTTEDVTHEFMIYAEGNQTVYVQLIGSKNAKLMEFKPDGYLYIHSNAHPAQNGKWHHVAITTHCSKGSSDIYLNGKLIEKNVASGNDVKRIKIISLYTAPNEGESNNGLTAIDNIRAYKGEKEPYFYVLYNDGVKTEDPSQADEVYISISKDSVFRSYLAEYSKNGKMTALDIVKPGEEARRIAGKGNFAKLLIWDKYIMLPRIESIVAGGNING